MNTSEKVKELLAQGKNNKQIAEELKIRPASVSYHFRKLNEPSHSRQIDWNEVQKFYDEGHSCRSCYSRFQITSSGWSKAVKRGDLITRTKHKIPIENYLKEDLEISSSTLKEKIFQAGLLENICSECGQLPTWNNKPLVLQLDHINGIRRDNRLENLRILCGHCHSQTETFCRGPIKTKVKKTCIDCEVVISDKSTRCRKCSIEVIKNLSRTSLEVQVNNKSITKEELSKLIWQKSITQIAKDFGVSDVAVGKWCRRWKLTKPNRGYWAKKKAKRT